MPDCRMIPIPFLFVVLMTFNTAPSSTRDAGIRQDLNTSRAWKPATYRGLTVGRSSRADMYRVFGKAKRLDDFKEDHEAWYIYEGVGELPGEFTVMVNTVSNKIIGMYLTPNDLSKEKAIKYFGNDYTVTKYDFCPSDDEESAPVYESRSGAASYIEYRSRGIALLIGYGDKVDEVYYVYKRIGWLSKKMCPATNKLSRRPRRTSAWSGLAMSGLLC